MTPEEAVARLAEIIAARSEFTEDDLYAAMAASGIPELVAERALKFTQIAWGRISLDGLGVGFAPDYFYFNGAGAIVESGLLSEEPYFVAAMAVAKRQPPAGLPRIARMSAEVGVVHGLLNEGSKPEDIATTPSALFTESPTAEGLAKVQKALSKRMKVGAKKPWWRFW